MRQYKREKLGTLALIAMMGMNGTVFASELQVVPKNGTVENSSVVNMEKSDYSLNASNSIGSNSQNSTIRKNSKRRKNSNSGELS